MIGPERSPYCWHCHRPAATYCIGCQHTMCLLHLSGHDTQGEIDHPETIYRWEAPTWLR